MILLTSVSLSSIVRVTHYYTSEKRMIVVSRITLINEYIIKVCWHTIASNAYIYYRLYYNLMTTKFIVSKTTFIPYTN